jgi:methylated-DNA-[protein]-cysteine S-methyltransferase
MNYQAKLIAPFGLLGIRCTIDALTGIDFLALTETPQRADSALAENICAQLLAYLENPGTVFSVPLKLCGTAHQLKVWQALQAIVPWVRLAAQIRFRSSFPAIVW